MTSSARHQSFGENLRWAGRPTVFVAILFSCFALTAGLITGFDAFAARDGISVQRVILSYFAAAAPATVVLALARPYLRFVGARIVTGGVVGAIVCIAITIVLGPTSKLVLLMGVTGAFIGAYVANGVFNSKPKG